MTTIHHFRYESRTSDNDLYDYISEPTVTANESALDEEYDTAVDFSYTNCAAYNKET